MNTLTITRPDDWHLHLRDGAALESVVRVHRAAVRARDRHAEPQAAGRDGRRGARVPRADHGRARAGRSGPGLRAADDALSHRQHLRRRDRAREGERFRARGQVLPCGCDDEFATPASRGSSARFPRSRRWQRHDVPLLVHGEVTDPEVDLFDRERVFIDTRARGHRAALSRPADRVRARHDARGGGVRGRRRSERRGDDHRASPALQPQRDLPRRPAAAPLLPAGAQARGAPRSARARRDRRQPEVLPRHRQRAASARREGVGVRLRRLLHRARGARALRRGVRPRRRARPARGVRELQRRRISTGCRATPDG